MKKSHYWMGIVLASLVASPVTATAKAARSAGGAANAHAPLQMEMIGMKNKAGWTAVVIALKNSGTRDSNLQCCTAFLETDAGYAVQSLNRDEIAAVNFNRAKTAATIGGIAGAALGIGGLAGHVDELAYAGLALGGASAIAGTVGSAKESGELRNLVIDDLMRVRQFPAGLKVAGTVYFPPQKKWPGSHTARTIHLTYRAGGQEYHVTAPVTMMAGK